MQLKYKCSVFFMPASITITLYALSSKQVVNNDEKKGAASTIAR